MNNLYPDISINLKRSGNFTIVWSSHFDHRSNEGPQPRVAASHREVVEIIESMLSQAPSTPAAAPTPPEVVSQVKSQKAPEQTQKSTKPPVVVKDGLQDSMMGPFCSEILGVLFDEAGKLNRDAIRSRLKGAAAIAAVISSLDLLIGLGYVEETHQESIPVYSLTDKIAPTIEKSLPRFVKANVGALGGRALFKLAHAQFPTATLSQIMLEIWLHSGTPSLETVYGDVTFATANMGAPQTQEQMDALLAEFPDLDEAKLRKCLALREPAKPEEPVPEPKEPEAPSGEKKQLSLADAAVLSDIREWLSDGRIPLDGSGFTAAALVECGMFDDKTKASGVLSRLALAGHIARSDRDKAGFRHSLVDAEPAAKPAAKPVQKSDDKKADPKPEAKKQEPKQDKKPEPKPESKPEVKAPPAPATPPAATPGAKPPTLAEAIWKSVEVERAARAIKDKKKFLQKLSDLAATHEVDPNDEKMNKVFVLLMRYDNAPTEAEMRSAVFGAAKATEKDEPEYEDGSLEQKLYEASRKMVAKGSVKSGADVTHLISKVAADFPESEVVSEDAMDTLLTELSGLTNAPSLEELRGELEFALETA